MVLSVFALYDTECYPHLLKVLIQITGANVPPRPLESMLLSCRKILASGEMGSPPYTGGAVVRSNLQPPHSPWPIHCH